MSKSFAITAANTTCTLDAGRKGEASFTVTNATNRATRAQLKLRPLGTTQPGWLSLDGGAERNFAPAETQQATVKVNVPASATPGKYNFRLDAVSVENPDEDYTEGQAVAVEVPAAASPPSPFPWWIVVAAVVVLLAVGGWVGWLVWPRDIVVAPVVGEPYDKARDLLEASGFTVSRKDEPNNTKPGHVFKQNPTASTKVKKGTEVELSVAVQEMVPVPQLATLTLTVRQARVALELVGLRVAGLRGDNLSNDPVNDESLVIRSEPEEGKPVAKDGGVTLIVRGKRVRPLPGEVHGPTNGPVAPE